MQDRILSSGELATKLDLPRWKLLYHIDKGHLPDASSRIEGRRLYTSEDVERIEAAYRELVKAKKKRKRHKAKV